MALPAAVPTLVWSDEFNQPVGAAPDSTRWVHDVGAGGWGNNELQSYTDSRDNSYVAADDGALDRRALAISALRTPVGGYTSARLKTQGLFSVTYGRIEARIKLPRGRGLWSAFWTLGVNLPTATWPACGEIDIMEQLGHDPGRAIGTLHGPGYSGGSGPTASTTLPDGASLSDGYHVYAVDWAPDKIEWSLDGRIYFSRAPSQLPAGTRWVFDSPQFLLLNVAVGGNLPGSPDSNTTFPQSMLVDYVRVYGRAPSAPPAVGGYSPSPGRASLSWTASSAVTGDAVSGYRIERATDRAFTQNLVARDIGAVTSFAESTPATTAYYYRISAISSGGVSDASETVQIQPATAAAPGGSGRLINLATRAYVSTGAGITIGGFVIGGSAPKRVLVRGVGPTLGALGVDGALLDPVIALLDVRGTLLATNDNWGDSADAADVAAAAAGAGAFPLAAGGKDAALIATLSPGSYTASLTGAAGTTGIALVEVYELP